jgi:hypothetical protein
VALAVALAVAAAVRGQQERLPPVVLAAVRGQQERLPPVVLAAAAVRGQQERMKKKTPSRGRHHRASGAGSKPVGQPLASIDIANNDSIQCLVS